MAEPLVNLNIQATGDAVNPTRFQPFEYSNNRWALSPLAGTDPKKLLDPTYWAHVANLLKQGDRVECFWEDASHWFDVIVLSVNKTSARVEVVNSKSFTKAAEKQQSMDPANYKPEFIQGNDKWRVLRISDNEVMTKGLETEQLAQEWIDENIAKKAAAKGKKAA